MFDGLPQDFTPSRHVPSGGKGSEGKGGESKGYSPLSDLEARISAEAAAAIEQPSSQAEDRSQRRTPVVDYAMVDAISAAQHQAANRRRGDNFSNIEDAQSQAASVRGQQQRPPGRLEPSNFQSKGIDNMIRGAQSAASRSASSQKSSSSDIYGGYAGYGGGWSSRSAQDFLGNWVDGHGNSVLVYSTDAWIAQLTAAISRPSRRDTVLTVRQQEDSSWCCGNSWLDEMQCSADRLHWVAGDGRVSNWTRARN